MKSLFTAIRNIKLLRWSAAWTLGLCATLPLLAVKCPSFPENCAELESISVGGYSLFYSAQGEAGPVVIFMAGEGDNTTVWRKVQPDVAAFARTFNYNRGGVGCSDLAPNPRTAAVIANELNAFLDALAIDEPVILCAHSLGGIFARYYTNQNPERVAALVLVDATHEDLENDVVRTPTVS